MNFVKKLFGKSEPLQFTIRTQETITPVTTDHVILDALEPMLENPDDFAVLESSRPIFDIEYVQVCQDREAGGIHLEFCLLCGKKRKLFCKSCSYEVCEHELLDFFHGTFQPQFSEYTLWMTMDVKK